MLQHNSNIVALLQSGPFCIEWNYAIEAWSGYMEQLELLKAGASYSELGIGARRAQTMPGIVTLQSGRPNVVHDPKLLKDVDQTPKGAFAHLRLEGVMRSQDGASSRGINSVIDDINMANANDRIEGILLEVNTGGGQAIAGQMLNTAIASSAKPVVVLGHMVASAGYMASMAAEEVIASSAAAQFGSIGTMMSLPTGWYANFYNKYYQDIYASKSTNKNAAFRAFLKGDLSGLKEQLEQTNEQFLSAVQESRNLKGSEKTVEHTLSGAMFNAKQARSRGLIDGIGGMDYALKRLQAAAKRRKHQ